MNAPAALSKIDQIRARDGDGCWLCGGKLDFNALPNSKKAPTKEHLVALSKGGTSALHNLVLCHAGCNRQLGDRPKAEKFAIRDKKEAARNRVPAGSGPTPATRQLDRQRDGSLARWRLIALIAIAVATFALGLAAGLLIAR